MLDAVARAQKILARRGHQLSIADIQAILWYYEKKLYGELGARQSAKISFEEAARESVAGRSPDVTEQGSHNEDAGLDGDQMAIGDETYTPLPPDPGTFNQSAFYSALEREIGGLRKLANKRVETEVAFNDQYKEKIDVLRNRLAEEGNTETDGPGKEWRGQSIREGVDAATRWARESEGQKGRKEGAGREVLPGRGNLHQGSAGTFNQSGLYSALKQEIGGLRKLANKRGEVKVG